MGAKLPHPRKSMHPFLLLILASALHGALGDTLAPTATGPDFTYYELHVTVSKGAPDCFTRDVILVNGVFQPTLETTVNNTLIVNVFNDIPAGFPQTASGISLHWHGFAMWNNATWMDGTSYVTQCPIPQGQNYTYSFLVDEAPGTYFWHDHSTANRANGLNGAVVVNAPEGTKYPYPWDEEYVVFLTDWYHTEGNTLAMALNRPYDPAKQTADTGMYKFPGNPDTLLVNGQGYAGDCNLADLSKAPNGYSVPTCEVTALTIPMATPPSSRKMLDATSSCGHPVFTVTKNKSYLFRLVNAATSTYLTVCFENHTVDVFTADSYPTMPYTTSCVDLNVGQRYDVLLKASKAASNYWISVHSQYTSAAPSAYAVLSYTGAPAHQIPRSPTPQPGMVPWSTDVWYEIVQHDGVIGQLDNYEYASYWNLFIRGGAYGLAVNAANTANVTVTFNMTQPLIEENGMARWAINNVAMPTDPPCEAIMIDLYNNPDWLNRTLHVQPGGLDRNATNAANHEMLGYNVIDNNHTNYVYIDSNPAPLFPAIGMHVVQLQGGELVDVILQNRPASEGNGDYRGVNRTNMNQHPIHFHGHHFWVLGFGNGTYNATQDEDYLNVFNPLYRDTITLPTGMWAYIRFNADNPGIWPMHCHIMWHHFQGQQVYFIEAMDKLPPPPTTRPVCSEKCIYNFAAYTQSYLNETYGNFTAGH